MKIATALKITVFLSVLPFYLFLFNYSFAAPSPTPSPKQSPSPNLSPEQSSSESKGQGAIKQYKPQPAQTPKSSPSPSKPSPKPTPGPIYCSGIYDPACHRGDPRLACEMYCNTKTHRCESSGRIYCTNFRPAQCRPKFQPCYCSLNPESCWYDATGKIDPKKKCELECNSYGNCVPSGDKWCPTDPVEKCHHNGYPCDCREDQKSCSRDKDGQYDSRLACLRKCDPVTHRCVDNPDKKWCDSTSTCYDKDKFCCQPYDWPKSPDGCGNLLIFDSFPVPSQHACCDKHDLCYRRGGPNGQKGACDNEFRQCLKAATRAIKQDITDEQFDAWFSENFDSLLNSEKNSFREHNEDCTCNVDTSGPDYDRYLDSASVWDDCCQGNSGTGCKDQCQVYFSKGPKKGQNKLYNCIHIQNDCPQCPSQIDNKCEKMTPDAVSKIVLDSLRQGDVNSDKVFDLKDLKQMNGGLLNSEDLSCKKYCTAEIPEPPLGKDPSPCKPLQGVPRPPNNCSSNIGSVSPFWITEPTNKCCYNRDVCYQIGGKQENRLACDKWFAECLFLSGLELSDYVGRITDVCGAVKTRTSEGINGAMLRVLTANGSTLFPSSFNYHCQDPCAFFDSISGGGGLAGTDFSIYWDKAIVTKQCGEGTDPIRKPYLELTIPKNSIPNKEWQELKKLLLGKGGLHVRMNEKGDIILSYFCLSLKSIADNWGSGAYRGSYFFKLRDN